MRGKKAKALRKLVYAGKDYRERIHTRTTKGIVNTGQSVKYQMPDGKMRQISLRRIYSRLKPMIKNVPYTEITKAVLGI